MAEWIFGTPLWTSENEPPALYPWLAKNEDCDVLVIGGGAAGAMAAARFAEAGVNIVLASRSPLGFEGTSVCGGMLTYDGGLMLTELSRKIGKEAAIRCFTLWSESIEKLHGTLPAGAEITCRNTLCFTDDETEADELHTEYLMRKHNGFNVDFLDRTQSRDRYSFPVEAGIYSGGLAVETDPYLLTHAAAAAAQQAGARIYENTDIVSIAAEEDGILAETSLGREIHARRVIMATGFEQDTYLGALAHKRTTYTLATEPVMSFAGYEDRCLIHRAGKPRLWARSTPDNRLLIGGLDSALAGSDGKLGRILGGDRLARARYEELETQLNLMFCAIPNIESAYTYGGITAETRDGLPVIGCSAEYPHIYFDLCSGPNGLLSADLASRLLLSAYKKEPNPDLALFSPERGTL